MNMMPGAPVMPGLQIQGERQSGQDVRTQNVTAVLAVANIVRTSLGPVGLDKVCQIGTAQLVSECTCVWMLGLKQQLLVSCKYARLPRCKVWQLPRQSS